MQEVTHPVVDPGFQVPRPESREMGARDRKQ